MARGFAMSRIAATAVFAALAIPLSGCGNSTPSTPVALPSTTIPVTTLPTVLSTTTGAPRPGAYAWSGTGVFSVGETPSGGAKAAIPAGRYRVELAKGSTAGVWYRCRGLPCGPTSNNWVDIGSGSGVGFSTVVDIAASDGALYMDGVTFIKVD